MGRVARLRVLEGAIPETGQKITVDVPTGLKRKKGRRPHVTMTDMDSMVRLDLTGSEWNVLHAMMRKVPEKGGSTAYCTLSEIAKTLGVRLSYVSRVVGDLKARRVLWNERQGQWHINTHLGWNGDFEGWAIASDQEPEPIWHRSGVDPVTGEVL